MKMLSRFVVSQAKHNSYFLVGLAVGVWVALVVVPLEDELRTCTGLASTVSPADEFEPQREEKPPGPAQAQALGRTVQRPRYYSTELGMRNSLLSGVLSSEAVLGTRASALNRTAARLLPSLKFFITASALQAAPGLANVVGFTDTREMLKPFHALKYLADNYLEEYDFFFLVSDATFVNARRLDELVSKLSVSADVYMGMVAEDDTHYCTLDGGILLSNSVLRAVHNELDWCVRNSYSPHHHENIGRCVLHAAHLSCTTQLQGEKYASVWLEEDQLSAALTPALADAVTVRPLHSPAAFYHLHAFVSRVHLERVARRVAATRASITRATRRLPTGYRNVTWPWGLRADVGPAPPRPDTRFDHARWTPFNATHAFMPDDHRAVAPLEGVWADATRLAVDAAREWAELRYGGSARLLEGAWMWDAPVALRYRLLLQVQKDNVGALRQLELVRPLGAARLVPVPYVTESARVTLVVIVACNEDTLTFLRHYEAVCLQRDKNTALVLVARCEVASVREAIDTLHTKYRDTNIRLVEPSSKTEVEDAARSALNEALPSLTRDALVLLLTTADVEFNEDFLNRVRMNCILGVQWFLPLPFSRFAQYLHPRFVDAAGNKPQVNTGRFNARRRLALAFHRQDYEAASGQWRGTASASVADLLAASTTLQCVRAPEPGLVVGGARSPPSPLPPPGALSSLDLGARHTLAKLILELQAESA